MLLLLFLLTVLGALFVNLYNTVLQVTLFLLLRRHCCTNKSCSKSCFFCESYKVCIFCRFYSYSERPKHIVVFAMAMLIVAVASMMLRVYCLSDLGYMRWYHVFGNSLKQFNFFWSGFVRRAWLNLKIACWSQLLFVVQPDVSLLGNGSNMGLSAADVTPSKMEDTHQTYMDMFAGPETDDVIDISPDTDSTIPV